MHKIKFPTLAIILLIIGIIWLLEEIGIIKIKIPWWPILLILVALGMIIHRYSKRK